METALADKTLLLQPKDKLLSIIQKLKKENQELSIEQIQLAKLKNENSTLRRHLNIKLEPDKKIIHAQIFLGDPPFWGASFKIAKGANAGIQLNDIVVTTIPTEEKLALVGRIVKISDHTATVGTIITPTVKFSVLLPKYNILGSLSGGGISDDIFWATVTYLPRDINFEQESSVYTSGVGVNTPGSIFIGKLAKGTEGKFTDKTVMNSLYSKVKLISPVDFTKLHFVMIITSKKSEQ
jgi:cell shape-determining protein MreC